MRDRDDRGERMIPRRGFFMTFAMAALLAVSPGLAATNKLSEKLREATEVYLTLIETPDREVPVALLERCNCVAVIPSVFKGAIGSGPVMAAA